MIVKITPSVLACKIQMLAKGSEKVMQNPWYRKNKFKLEAEVKEDKGHASESTSGKGAIRFVLRILP